MTIRYHVTDSRYCSEWRTVCPALRRHGTDIGGGTREEALTHIDTAIQMMLEQMQSDGIPPPPDETVPKCVVPIFAAEGRRNRMAISFARTIGIDYSGATTPTASLKGLRVYKVEGDGHPVEVPPPPSPRKYWTRKGIAEWLVERLDEDLPTLVGIDHGFSFPLCYFDHHGLLHDWPTFLDDFQRHWSTDEDHT